MTISVVPDTNVAMSMALGGINQNMIEYAQQSYNNFMEKVGNLGNNFVNMVAQTFDYFNNSDVINSVKNVLTNNEVIIREDVIYTMDMYNAFSPTYTMKRYVMADPTLFNKYENNRLYGWDGDFYNPEPEIKNPYYREDYLHTTDEIMVWENNDDEATVNFVSSEYDNPLSIDDRLKVMRSWEVMNEMLRMDIDPTDPDEKSKLEKYFKD